MQLAGRTLLFSRNLQKLYSKINKHSMIGAILRIPKLKNNSVMCDIKDNFKLKYKYLAIADHF